MNNTTKNRNPEDNTPTFKVNEIKNLEKNLKLNYKQVRYTNRPIFPGRVSALAAG